MILAVVVHLVLVLPEAAIGRMGWKVRALGTGLRRSARTAITPHGAWFRSRWPGEIIFFQVGKYFELYGKDSVWANLVFGLRHIKPRFCDTSSVGVPKRMIVEKVKKTHNLGLGVLTVTESGYPLYRLKERLPDILVEPPAYRAVGITHECWRLRFLRVIRVARVRG